MEQWRGARCSEDFCTAIVTRKARRFTLLLSRTDAYIDELALAAACERADIVVADRRLPASCRPRMLKADRIFLRRTGGLAIYLETGRVRTVAGAEGAHGWSRLENAALPSTARRAAVRPH